MNLLYIGNTLVDLYPDTVISQTLQAFEIGQIGSVRANFTNQLSVPKTANNKAIFGFADLVSSQSTKPYTKLPARVVQGGIETIPEGVAIVTQTDDAFNINIFSGAFDFFQLIEGEFINALDYSAYDDVGAWSKAVADGWRNTTDGIVAPVLQYGLNLRDSAGTIFNTLTVLDIEYSLPSYYYHTIIEKIISEAGYTKSGDIFSDSKYLNLIVPAGNTKNQGNYSDAFYDARNFRASAAGGQSIVNPGSPDHTPIEFTNVTFNGAKEYYNGTDGYQRDGSENDNFMMDIYVWLDTTVSGSGGSVRLAITSDGTSIQSISDEATTGIYEASLQLSADTLALGELGVGVSTDVNPATCVINGGVFQVKTSGSPFTQYGITWTNDNLQIYSEGLPAILKKDFIRDFVLRFGQIMKEKDDVLYFKGIDDLIADRANAVDWTAKRDTSKIETLTYADGGIAQTNVIKYDVSDTKLTDEYTGRGTFEVANEGLPIKSEQTSIFSSSRTGGGTVGIMSAIIEVWEDTTDSDYDNDPGFRLLAVRDKESTEPSVTWDSSARTDYKVAYFEDPRYGSCSFQSFLDAYYPNFIAAVQNLKILKRYYRLSPMDIAAFDPFKLIYDDGQYFIVQKINNFIPGQSTKVELFKVS